MADPQTQTPVKGRREREFAVKHGGAHDKCRRCGIWRVNAGFLRETCGPGWGDDECFVIPPAARGSDA